MTPDRQAAPPARSGKWGVAIIAILAVVFIVLVAMVVKFAGGEAPSEPPPPEELVVIPARLRIRTEPSAKAAVVTVALRGQRLTLVEDAGAWVRVRTSDDLTGWAERSALEAGGEHERRIERTAALRKMPPLEGRVQQDAALFAGPGIFYPPVGELKAGARVQVYTRDHDFYAIEAGDGIAYAEIDSIELTAPGGAELEVASRQPRPNETPEAVPGLFPTPGATPVSTPEPAPTPEERGERERVARGPYRVVPAGGTSPVLIDQVQPRYPALARRSGTEGRVILRAVIRRDGSVGNVEILRDLPYGLGEAAREAVRQWRFRPATYRGEPISVYYNVTVNFRLTD